MSHTNDALGRRHRYGGIFERGALEYTLDDFHSLALDKLDRYVTLKASQIVIAEGDGESSEEDDEEDGQGSSSDDDDTESVTSTVVAEEEGKEVEIGILDTIEEEAKVCA